MPRIPARPALPDPHPGFQSDYGSADHAIRDQVDGIQLASQWTPQDDGTRGLGELQKYVAGIPAGARDVVKGMGYLTGAGPKMNGVAGEHVAGDAEPDHDAAFVFGDGLSSEQIRYVLDHEMGHLLTSSGDLTDEIARSATAADLNYYGPDALTGWQQIAAADQAAGTAFAARAITWNLPFPQDDPLHIPRAGTTSVSGYGQQGGSDEDIAESVAMLRQSARPGGLGSYSDADGSHVVTFADLFPNRAAVLLGAEKTGLFVRNP